MVRLGGGVVSSYKTLWCVFSCVLMEMMGGVGSW